MQPLLDLHIDIFNSLKMYASKMLLSGNKWKSKNLPVLSFAMVRAACGWALWCNSSTHSDSKHTPQVYSVWLKMTSIGCRCAMGGYPPKRFCACLRTQLPSPFLVLSSWTVILQGIWNASMLWTLLDHRLTAHSGLPWAHAFCLGKRITDCTLYLVPFFQYGCQGSTDTEKGVLSALPNKFPTR
jgi:hypothetical protein